MDKNGKVIVWQAPNLPLWSWFIFMLLSKIISRGGLYSAFKYLSAVSLLVWAVLEITKGDSYFRRFIGLAILLFTIITHI
jgi:hypothetical protein